MSKKPMKFLPPDDPTAVYPIRATKLDEDGLDVPEPEPEPEAAAPEPEPPHEPLDEDFGVRPSSAHAATPAASAGGPNPLILLAFLAVGMLLAAGVLGALAFGLFLTR
ncbi:MAG: hypothetical protein H6737_01175 [Alphaproteobacteria bacterium]|nr:hypothetical protein [Alphaproteobacteria bacterium]